MNREKLTELYKKYELSKDDIFKHKHYVIITRQGIDKIQSKANIQISYEVIESQKEFCIVKATGTHSEIKDGRRIELKVETFGSALYGTKIQNDQGKWMDTGTTQSWYVMEIAEKRAMSRVVLKLTGFYELGAFGEDESDDFKQS
jgi:hypothetical protein